MESHSYASYPESGDSSPRSREIDCENASLPWDEPPPPASARVKLMCSYGGRIQPRSHDNQLSYVGGETKILAVDRSIRFQAILPRLAALLPGGADDVCIKYQLPGEDLDALISVTNDEDLEHMMLEYDRLLRPAAKPAPRLRLFLFPIGNAGSIGSAAASPEQKPDRQWFVDALNSVPAQQPPPQLDATSAPPPPAMASPDYLFGLDAGFVPPPAVKVRDPAPEPAVLEPLSVEIPARSDLGGKDDRHIGGETIASTAEIQRQIQELQRMQIAAENQQQQAAGFHRNGSDETLSARALPGEYYLPWAQDKAPPAATAQIPTAYWPEPRGVPATARYASVAGGDQPFYFIPTAPGMYPGTYYTAMPRMMPAEAYRDAAAMYAMGPPPTQQQQQPAKVAGGPYPEGSGGVVRSAQQQQQQGSDGAGFPATQVAYDSAGRAVYYKSAVPAYQTVTSVGPINPVEGK